MFSGSNPWPGRKDAEMPESNSRVMPLGETWSSAYFGSAMSAYFILNIVSSCFAGIWRKLLHVSRMDIGNKLENVGSWQLSWSGQKAETTYESML